MKFSIEKKYFAFLFRKQKRMYNKTEKMLQKSREIAAYMSLEIARELERKDDEDAAAEDDEADVNMRSMRSKKKNTRAQDTIAGERR